MSLKESVIHINILFYTNTNIRKHQLRLPLKNWLGREISKIKWQKVNKSALLYLKELRMTLSSNSSLTLTNYKFLISALQ